MLDTYATEESDGEFHMTLDHLSASQNASVRGREHFYLSTTYDCAQAVNERGSVGKR